MDKLAGLAVLLETARLAARLVVEQDDLRAGTNLLQVAEARALAADAAAVHAHPQVAFPILDHRTHYPKRHVES